MNKQNFRIDNFKMLEGDYEVSISKKRISKFASKMNDLTYFIAVEADCIHVLIRLDEQHQWNHVLATTRVETSSYDIW